MSRAAFIPTHRLHVRTPTGDGDLFVRLEPDREGHGPAWSALAWKEKAAADFWCSRSRWIYVGSGEPVAVLHVRRWRVGPSVARR